MKIKVLGTRGEVEESAPYHSKHSGVLIDKTLLLDCGERSFLNYHPKAVAITHLHPDHAFFVRDQSDWPSQISLYAPEKYKTVPIVVPDKPFVIENYAITPIPTIHSVKVRSQAYLIVHDNKKILYTGDMIWIEKQYHTLLDNLDLVITEASFMRCGGIVRRDEKTGKIYGHTGVPDSIALFKKYTSRILLVHFGAWFYRDIKAARKDIAHLARENALEIIVGYDGLELTV